MTLACAASARAATRRCCRVKGLVSGSNERCVARRTYPNAELVVPSAKGQRPGLLQLGDAAASQIGETLGRVLGSENGRSAVGGRSGPLLDGLLESPEKEIHLLLHET